MSQNSMSEGTDPSRRWMVRTKDLYLSRPMSEKELIKKIEKGDFSPLDEVCPGTGYWFGLHETEEVRKFLGDVDLSRLTTGLEVEITSSTETRTLNRTLILEMPKRVETTVAPASIFETTESRVDLSVRTSQASVGSSRSKTSAREKYWTTLLAYAFGFLILLIYLWSWSA